MLFAGIRLKLRKTLKNAVRTPSRVHALLGGIIAFKNPFIQVVLALGPRWI
jgi:hypothetical protein